MCIPSINRILRSKKKIVLVYFSDERMNSLERSVTLIAQIKCQVSPLKRCESVNPLIYFKTGKKMDIYSFFRTITRNIFAVAMQR